MRKIFHPSRAFTLIEVMVAIFVIGAILITSAAIVHSTKINLITRNHDLALKIAHNEVEALRALGYAALPASGPFSDISLTSLPSGAGALTISSYNAKTKQVVVTVSWVEQGGVSHTVTLTTLITQIGAL